MDPNARTQAVGGIPPQREPEPEMERTALYPGGAGPLPDPAAYDGGADGGEPHLAEPGGPRRPNRRRLLLAAGGLMLVAGGGVATALTMNGGSRNPAASGPASTSPSPTLPATTAPASSAPPSPSASATPSSTGAVNAPQYYVDDEGPTAIALTLDDGPSAEFTPQVLEILRRYDIKATFNMIGRQVGSNLSLVREVSSEGHTITNHTWDHADLTHLTYSQVISEIDRCNDALSAANQHPTIFRAPFGNWSKAVYRACADRQLRPVAWSVDPRDWDTSHVTTQMIVHNVLTHTRAHDIILEHDGPSDRRNTVAALKIFIPELLDRGFRFVAM
ncbi:MAG TPA: polysaccharide deacetylase family protein [Actinospica sp.]|nr:polysaccharide deacetylase family protein [Actinospica sp.]